MINNVKKLFWILYLIFATTAAAEMKVYKQADDLYFVMEKINEENIKQWYEFADKAYRNYEKWNRILTFIEGVVPAEDLDDFGGPFIKPLKEVKNSELKKLIINYTDPMSELKKKYAILQGIPDGNSNFKKSLGNYTAKSSDVWVAYISSINPAEDENEHNKFDSIEMAMSVLVKQESPVSMHMGIFRNPSYLMSPHPAHARVSPKLHAYAAKIALEKYPSLQVMVTTPLSSMATIFRNILPENSFAEGMNKKGAWIIRDEEEAPANEKGFKFILYDRDINDPQKNLILMIDEKNKDDYWWLVSRLHTSLSMHPYFATKLETLASLLE